MEACRLLVIVCCAGASLWAIGCRPLVETAELPPVLDGAALPADDQLRGELDEVLEATYDRRLNLQEHAAWQILHGALAFGREFRVEREPGGEMIAAVDHLLDGGTLKGWTTRPGIELDAASGRRGLQAVLESGSQSGQGHTDQWLAVLAQCQLEATQTILVDDHRYTMADYVDQVKWDVPRNVAQEYSWTLIGLTTYLPTEHAWTASDGQSWSIERLVEIELDQDLADSACGGTHRLIGVTMALNQHLAQGGRLTGVWARADEVIQQAISEAQTYQNADGSFSTNYFQRPGNSPDLAQNLGTTGHTLEFLTLAMTDQQLQQPWVARAVLNLCDLFRKTQHVALECGALYHAAHGLVLYRQRVFGERSFGGQRGS